MLRSAVGRVCAAFYKILSRGRITGGPYLLLKPVRVRTVAGATVAIGERVVIEQGARVVVHGRLVIGDDVYIGKNVTIVAFESVEIGERTLIAENVSIHDEDHGRAGARMAYRTAPVTIGRDVWLCAGVVVTRGSVVGAESTIAANATVRGEIPPDVLAGGVPARVLKEYHPEREREITLGEET